MTKGSMVQLFISQILYVSFCCCNKWLHNWWLKTTQIHCLAVLEVRSLQRCWQHCFLLEASARICFFAFSSSQRPSPFLGPWACINIASYPPVCRVTLLLPLIICLPLIRCLILDTPDYSWAPPPHLKSLTPIRPSSIEGNKLTGSED